MNELTKRILTSVVLITILISMFFYNYIFIIILLLFGTIILVELNQLLVKIFKKKYIRTLMSFFALTYIFYILWLAIISVQTNDTKFFFIIFNSCLHHV